jgi:hypothetical protein
MPGFGPCYHMMNVLTDSSLIPGWADALDGRADWDKVFAGFNATVDYPGAFYVRELAAAYPDAKVVLSTRDGHSWARSIHDTLWDIMYGGGLVYHLMLAQAEVDPGMRAHRNLMTSMLGQAGLFGPDPERFDADILADAMERHNAAVRECVPAGRLLEWHPADGWEPLCEFLGRPVPSAPVPHVNDSAAAKAWIIARSLEALNSWHARQPPPEGLP